MFDFEKSGRRTIDCPEDIIFLRDALSQGCTEKNSEAGGEAYDVERINFMLPGD